MPGRDVKIQDPCPQVSEPVWLSGKALSRRASVRFRFDSLFFLKRLWFVDSLLSITINETIKWLSSVLIRVNAGAILVVTV